MITFLILLLLCQLAGEVLALYFALPIPGPVIGMALLFCILTIRGNVAASLGSLSDNLLSHLPLLFVPAGVGVMVHAERLGAEILPIAGSIAVSTFVTLIVTGWIMQKLSKERAEP